MEYVFLQYLGGFAFLFSFLESVVASEKSPNEYDFHSFVYEPFISSQRNF